MKHINKHGAPKQYVNWRKRMAGQKNESFLHLQNPEKKILHETLVEEQGSICGYTMRRIDLDSSHLEHIKPESLCRDDLKGSDLDYENLIACYPRGNVKPKYSYGARLKDDWWNDDGRLFISPLDARCERLIQYNLKGEVFAYKKNDSALNTIAVLKLDHTSLTDDRKRVIEEFIFSSSGYDAISKKQAQTAIREILEADNDGMFIEFCVAIRYALLEYVSWIDKTAEKRKFAIQQKKKKK